MTGFSPNNAQFYRANGTFNLMKTTNKLLWHYIYMCCQIISMLKHIHCPGSWIKAGKAMDLNQHIPIEGNLSI